MNAPAPKSLPVASPPQTGESLLGYVTRLASENGRRTPQQLFVDCGRRWGDLHGLSSPSEPIISFLAGMTGFDPEIFSFDMVLPEPYKGIPATSTIYRKLTLKFPRVCSTCLSEEPVHQAYWQNLPITHCLIHNQPLTSVCPSCNKTLGWNTALLDGRCEDCGHHLATTASNTVALPAYLQGLLSLNKAGQPSAYTSDLLVAAQRAFRPFDSCVEVSERPPEAVTDWHEALELGYRLLTNPECQASWATGCRLARTSCSRLGSDATYLPILEAQRNLVLDWPLTHFAPEKSGQKNASIQLLSSTSTAIARPMRLRIADSGSQDSALMHQVTLRQMASVLGCETREVSVLTDQDCLKRTNQTKSLRDMFFDLESAAECVSIETTLRTGITYIELSEAFRLCPLFDVDRGIVLTALFRGNVHAVRPSDSKALFSELKVGKVSLLRFLTREFKNSPDKPITGRQVSNILRISGREIEELCDIGLLKKQPWPRVGFAYQKNHVKDILQNYTVVPRCAFIAKQTRRSLSGRFQSAGVDPLVSTTLYARGAKATLSSLSGMHD